MYKFFKIFKILVLISISLFLYNVNVEKDIGVVYNNNSNKVLDLTSMALKMEEIKMNDLYSVKDTYVGDLTAYVADCPLCGGTLGCTGQNVLDRTVKYNDVEYGNVNIVASSTNLSCGSVIQFERNGEKITAIVLDRGVTGTNLDLLVADVNDAYSLGRKNISYNILRYGWSRTNS